MHATGTSYDKHKNKILDLWPEDSKEKVHSLTEMQQKKFFEDKALHFIRANPVEAATLYLKKVYYFWWFSPQSGIIYPNSYLGVYKYFYTFLVSFFIVGIGFAIASSKEKLWNLP